MTRFRRVLAAVSWMLSLIGQGVVSSARELVFFAGLLLLAGGFGLVYLPAAFIVPGAILTWLAIPPAPHARKP
jgi:hypothetical protein